MQRDFVPSGVLNLESFQEDFVAFLGLSSDVILELSRLVSEYGTFIPNSPMLAKAPSLNLSHNAVSSALGVAKFIYDHSRHEKLTAEQAVEEVSRVARTLGHDIDPSKVAAYIELLASKPRYDSRERLSTALGKGPERLEVLLGDRR